MVPAFTPSSKVLREKDINDPHGKKLLLLMPPGWTILELALHTAFVKFYSKRKNSFNYSILTRNIALMTNNNEDIDIGVNNRFFFY